MSDASAAPLSAEVRALSRHAVAALSFRFEHAVAGLPADVTTEDPVNIADFDVGHGVRTPHDLVVHMTRVVWLGLGLLGPGDAPGQPSSWASSWTQALDDFRASLRALDDRLADVRTTVASGDLERLVHGPICDVASHIGQLLLLRRLAGLPAEKVSYLRADVSAGRLAPSPLD